jgi:hypothetical protein
MMKTTSRTILLALLVAGMLLGVRAEAAVQTLTGKRLVARTGSTERFVFVSTAAVNAPARGGPDDPTVAGAVVQIINPTTQEYGTFPLAADKWKANAAGTRYTYRDPAGPVQSVVIRAGRRMRVRSRAVGITLNEPSQGSLGVNLVSGGQQYCAVFGGTVVRDEPGRFVARGAPAPASCPSNTPACASARVIASQNDVIEGPLSRGRLGDYLIANDKIQVTVQQNGRVFFGIGPYGGNIIDADLWRPFGGERDSFEELSPGINLENTAHYTDATIINDGADCQPAVVRFTGVDDLLDYVNGSSAIRDMGFMFPSSADDRDLPVEVETDYTLATGQNYVRIDTTIANTGLSPLGIYFAEYVNGSGQVEMWRPAYGFGEPLATTTCPPSSYVACSAGTCDLCNFIAFSGEDQADGVSYGYIYTANGSTAVTVSGVTVPVHGQEAVAVFLGAGAPNFNLGPAGLPGDSVTLTRYFAVGDGSVASIAEARNAIQGITAGTLTGNVTSGGNPVARADVVAIRTGSSAPALLALNIANHTRTAGDGSYRMTLPPGTYNVRVNKDGRLFGSPDPASLTIVAGANAQNFTLPAPGRLHVTVTDASGAPSPAKVQLVGFDPSPDPLNTQDVLGALTNRTGVFGEQFEDGLAYGIAAVAFAGRSGDTGTFEVEPGSYQLVVSRGPRHSAFTQPVTISAGITTTVAAQVARVIQTPGFISADFHVHGLDSPDCEVTKEERITTMLAEGMDMFTPSEHEVRADFAPTIAAMGVSSLISTIPNAEITTFDYGHFNSWPVTIDPMQLHGGGIDWGRPGPSPGTDFPSLGSYVLTPAEIYAAAHADTPGNVIQINHMRSHFDTSGLDIDTAMTPPQSFKAASERRLDPMVSNFFDSGFDALEVWIGTDGRTGDLEHFVGENLGDWFNMLNLGIRRTGVADSDTHQRRTTQINARTYVASAVTTPGALSAQALTLAANVRNGRATGTNAPFVTVTASAPSTGQSAGLGAGQNTMLATTNGMVDVTVTVKSPLWAEFDRIQLFVNNAPQPFDHDGDGATRNRYRVIPNVQQVAGTDFAVATVNDFPGIPGASHLEATAVFPLSGIVADSWIVVLVRGTDGVSHPLFPVLPNSLASAGNTTLAQLTDGNLGELGIMALAFTNPLFIDANNDAVWTPPGVMLTPP